MKPHHLICRALLPKLLLGACDKDNPDLFLPRPVNQAPLAHAGRDLVFGALPVKVTLSGRGSDPEGTLSGYSWRTLSGTPGSIRESSDHRSVKLTLLDYGEYQFEFRVTDTGGLTARDTVMIRVIAGYREDPCAGCWDY